MDSNLFVLHIHVQACLMSQSWDNVASVHDHLLTGHAHKTFRNSIISTVCMRRFKRLLAETTPLIASNRSGCNGDVVTLLECCYRTTDRYDKKQTSPVASLEAQWLSASACLAGLSKHAVLSCRSFDNASVWPEALRPLFFLHTALQF